jgi:hypothetical protein
MVDAGLSQSTRWALGAVFAVLSSLALAKGPSMPHGGGPGGGYPHASFQHQGHDSARTYAYRNERGTRGAGGDHGGYNASQRIAGPNDGYRANNNRAENRGYSQAYNPGYNQGDRGGFQYAGAITQVSAETRSVPRPPEDESLVRAGSIRADVARYNEERGASRPAPRPPEYMSRPPGPSPYRN